MSYKYKDRLLIFDLDNTIFDTRSIEEVSLNHILDQCFLDSHYSACQLEEVYNDLWSYPFDVVSEKYSFDDELVRAFENAISEASFKFNIQVFNDLNFDELRDYKKILVTTGFYNLQNAKIDALDIRSHFEEVFIDDPLAERRDYKKGIFQNVIKTTNLSSRSVVVIGDNPESELIAAKELGLKTIQMCLVGQAPTTDWDLCISSYRGFRMLLDKLF